MTNAESEALCKRARPDKSPYNRFNVDLFDTGDITEGDITEACEYALAALSREV